jgi:hypothetical protein
LAENDYVQMLRESLEKKVEILKEIRVKNAEQGRILTDPNADPDDFSENIEAKGALVDEITKLDDGFEIVFEKVSEELQKNREAYKDEIIRMKELIAQITDLTAEVEREEQQNKSLAEAKFADVRAQVKKVRKSQTAVTNYYHNMMKTNYDDPQFMDRKK